MSSGLEGAIPNWDAPTLQGFDLTNIQDGERIRGSRRQYVRFYMKKFMKICADKVEKNEKTGSVKVLTTKSVPIMKEMVEIITPGDTNKYDGEVDDYHRREFWPQYNAFRQNKGQVPGTPLDECEWVPSSLILELACMGCKTLEQLADASDHFCNQVPNGWEMREFARQQCKVNAENANSGVIRAMSSEISQLREQVKLLLDARGEPVPPSEDVTPEIEPTVSDVRRGPGRPRKQVEE